MPRGDVKAAKKMRECGHEAVQSAPKEPEITQTSPSGEREHHEKYSAPVSAATRISWKSAREGGGLAAANVCFRWLMMQSMTE